jgi:hypothetical protein
MCENVAARGKQKKPSVSSLTLKTRASLFVNTQNYGMRLLTRGINLAIAEFETN